ncbi:DUF6520 family protein [Mesonia mobilis]|uniref:DUF6520 family protein n=1 Tax=Mesonia mobilis TaxID=369791 RepID=UPI0026ED459F|nr:DUF6520 family protein [Mesonia mobilis]|tara:strand:- start:1933 stop:2211 length:279 start_codon:yes stop_codon:yes gene_type:complete
MKNLKLTMPLMAFVLAVGLAFANKANVQSAGWVERNGVAYQLQNEACTSNTDDLCKVIFANDPNGVEHQVYMEESLTNVKRGGSNVPYIIFE